MGQQHVDHYRQYLSKVAARIKEPAVLGDVDADDGALGGVSGEAGSDGGGTAADVEDGVGGFEVRE